MNAIRDLMVKKTVAVGPGRTVGEAVSQMGRNGVGAVLIVDGGRLVGLFTERDLLNRVVREGRDPHKTAVGDVATRSLVTIDIEEAPKRILEIFRAGRFRHLPVLDQGVPVGILSTRDFLDVVVGGFERCFEELEYRSELGKGSDPYDHMGGSYGR